MARLWTTKRLWFALAVVLATVPVAYAAVSARADTEMLYACAKKSGGQLRYAAAAGDCRTSSERLIRFRDGEPVAACAHRGGYVYAVATPAACKSKAHRPSLALTLPDDARHTFCADKRRGWLRSTQHAPYARQRPQRGGDTTCKSSERRVFVKRAKRPDAVDDTATVDEDHSVSIAVLANDLARKSKPLTVASVDTSGTAGSVAIAADRLSATYDPNGQFEDLGVGASDTDGFTYVATDGKRSDSASVTVTVTGVNDAPSAVADAASTNEDTATTIAVLANDTDPDTGDALSVTAVTTTGTAGAVTINPNGTVGYDPSGEFDDLAPGEQRVDQFGYTASDGHGGTAGATVSVTVSGVNDAASLTTSAGTLSYTEGDPATVVDGGLKVADPDDTSLAGARVRLSTGFQPADELLFTNQNGITGSYNSGTGVLTLTGSSSVANYQTALRSVQYRHTGDDPSAAKTVEFRADDGDGLGPAATRGIDVTPVNDAPSVATSPGSASWTEGGGPVVIDGGVGVTDPDSALLSGATVAITSNLVSAQDLLGFAAQFGITGSYAPGVLTLTGAATVANYQTVLRSVTYGNSSNDPSTATREASFQVTDAGALTSNTATRDVTIAGTNNPPAVTTSAGSTTYTEQAAAVVVDGALTVADADDANLESATVEIATGFGSGDALDFTDQNGITGSYDAGTGLLTLTGTSSVANYQTALRSVAFGSTSDAPGTSRTIEFIVNDGNADSAPATKSIAVAPVNDAPVAQPGSRSTDEDTPLTLNLAALVSDAETADGELTYEIVTQPDHGTATASTYTPDDDYNGPDSLTYKVTDRGDPDDCSSAPCDGPLTSTTETVSITVDPVNDAPVAQPASVSTDEDTPLPLDLAALVSDVETADPNLTYEIVTQPDHGTATASTYTPDGEYNGPDSFTYRVIDRGDPDNCSSAPCDGPETSTTETVSITVNSLNDAPVNLLPAGPVGAVQDADNPLTGISAADVDAAADDVELTLSVEHGTLTVDTAVLGGVGPLQVADNGSATVVVTASLAQINTTLADANGLVYHPDLGYTGPDTLTVISDDLGHNGAGGQLTDTDTLAIVVSPPNAAPVAGSQSVSTNEDTAKTITLSASDADGDDPLSFAKGALPTHGSLGTIGPVTCNHLVPNVCTADVGYTPGADYNGPDSFTFTANDGIVDSAAATVSITVDAVNDAPKLENTEAGALAYTENDPATLLTGTTTVSDVDSPNFDTGTLTVDWALGGTADDRLEIQNQGTGPGQIGVSGADISFGGTTIGTFTGGVGTTPLTVTLNASSTPAAVQALVRAVTYRNVSENPSIAARTARFVVTDGDGGTSAPATRSITLTAVNDPPVLAAIEAGALAYTENDAATAITATLTVTDPDSNVTGATVTIGTNLAPAQDVLSFVNQLGITGSYNAGTGVLTLTGSATPADYQTALRSVKYANTSEDPSTLTRTVQFQVQDGPAPANLSNVQSRDITVTAVNDAPVADDETFNGTSSAVGNTTLVVNDPDDGAPATPDPTDTSPVTDRPHKTISGDILAGDTDIDGPGPLTITPGTFATNDGGSVTVEADGDFTFEPAASVSCTDTSDFFDYTVEDSGSPEQTDTGRVTIAISGCVWYVNNDDAQGNSGTSEKPFDTLAQAETASGTGHSIFVYDGSNTTTGYAAGINLKANQKLIGEAATLTVGSDTLHGADAANKPTLTDNNADVVDLDDANEVRGFNIDPQGTGGGIAGSSGDTGGGTIDDVNIVDTGTAGTQPGLELDTTTGTFNVSNLIVSNGDNNAATSTDIGVRLNNAGTVSFAPAGTISITTAGAAGLSATGTGMDTSTFDAITVTGSGSGGVSMSGTSGTTTFDALSLTTTSGAAAAFGLATAGTVAVSAAGTANVSATGGPAVDVTGTSGATLAFDDVDSTGSASDGVNIAGLGAGTFTANSSSTITNAATIDFDLDGGTGAVTYDGTITDDVGQLVRIANTTGGTKDFNGNITDGGDGDGSGIALTTNTGATIRFDGGLTLATGANAAFAATGGGTVNVTGAGNTLATTTGTALNVVSTTIGGSGLNFRSIAANGGANGIVLIGTGASGGLTVSGTGSAGSGGSITGIAGADVLTNNCGDLGLVAPAGVGVYLKNTSSPSLSFMSFPGTFGNFGILGYNVAGFTLANSTMTGTYGDNVNTDEDAVHFCTLTGSASFSNDTISNGAESNLRVVNASGTLNRLTLQSSTVGLNQSGGGGGTLFEADGGTFNATVLNTTFQGSRGSPFQAVPQAGATMDLVFGSPGNGNTVHNTHGNIVSFAQNLNVAAGGTLTFDINSNHFDSAAAVQAQGGVFINAANSTANASGYFRNNTIGNSGVADSGSSGNDPALDVESNGGGDLTIVVDNNTMFQWGSNGAGLLLQAGANSGSPTSVNATVTNNTIAQPGTFAVANTAQGFQLNNGTNSGENFTTCLRFANNVVDQAGTGAGGDVRLRQRFDTKVQMPGYTGAADGTTGSPTVVSYIQGLNPTGPPTVTSVSSTAAGGGFFNTPGGAACALPGF